MKCIQSGKSTANDVFQLFLSVIFYRLFLQLFVFSATFLFHFNFIQTLVSLYLYLRVMEIVVLFIYHLLFRSFGV